MILTPSQNIIAEDLHRFRVVCCGRRFGKTTEAVEEIKGKSVSKPSSISYIAPTYQQSRDIAWEMLKRELRPIITQVNESRLELRVRTIESGESSITLRGWESIETLRGQKLDFVVIDEVAMMRNFWPSWQEVIRPTLTDTKGEGLFISTPKGFNHFYDLYNLENSDPDFKSFHFTSYDNPYLPTDEIEKARRELTEDRFAQEYLADFRKTEGLVYKEFDRDKDTYDELPEIKIIYKLIGVDFGYVNPAAVITIYKDDRGLYWVDDEYYKSGKTDAEIAEYVSSIESNKAYPDPENPGGIEELSRRKVNVQEVRKGKDSIKSGIQRIRDLLKQGRIKINKKCVNTIYELETYSYSDKSEENPIPENNHALDAIRYVVMMDDYTKFQTKTQEEIMRDRENLKQFDFYNKRISQKRRGLDRY